mmetsp:Transcript_13691/g.22820  ORF Transcript_13691/g.22820 Transcript_13691/m.22820 type:complete len:228 (+) Transcript_13691:467-1150(+)
MVSLVNAERRARGLPTVGWLNPALYALHAQYQHQHQYNHMSNETNNESEYATTREDPSVVGNRSDASGGDEEDGSEDGSDEGESIVVEPFLNDITEGNNQCVAGVRICCPQGFDAQTGWDPVTGLGTLDFERFKHAMMTIPTLYPQPQSKPRSQPREQEKDHDPYQDFKEARPPLMAHTSHATGRLHFHAAVVWVVAVVALSALCLCWRRYYYARTNYVLLHVISLI